MILYHRKLGKGPPVIILHGIFGSSDNWGLIAKNLSDHNTVYLVDQRNHGRSFHDDAFNYQVMVNDLLELLDHLNLDQVSVVGHSMGGKTAMNLAVNHPDEVDRLVVVDIAPGAYKVHHQDIIDSLRALDLNSIQSRGDADALLKENIPEYAVRQFLLKNLRRSSQGFKWKLNLNAIANNLNQVSTAIPADGIFDKSTLFIAGEKSNYIKAEDRTTIKKHFPQSTIMTVKNAGHWVHADAPDILNDILIRFLNPKNETG